MDARVDEQCRRCADEVVKLTNNSKFHPLELTVSTVRVRGCLNSSQKNEHQENDEDEPERPAGEIAPAATIWPSRQGADNENKKND